MAYKIVGDAIDYYQYAIGHWADEQFPHATDQSRIAHLKKELVELEEAETLGKGKLAEAEELADIVMLCMHYGHANGIDLGAAIRRKFEVVQARTYPDRPGPDGTTEHHRG